MNRKLFIAGLSAAVALSVVLAFATGALAKDKRGGQTYEVTITNLTRGQIFSPPVVISHNGNYSLFSLGQPASDQLYPLAEDANTGPLTTQLEGLNSVFDYTVAGGAVPPGGSITLEIQVKGFKRQITVAGMLVTTNDAFFAIHGVPAPLAGTQVEFAEAYDAGSEANSESCATVPGPPCGSGGVRDTAGAEGFVFIHAGIHGDGDLIPASDDWRNPVAIITIRRK